jgi:predicted acyltransferase
LFSLDVFRGATVAAMILVNHPGNDFAYAPLKHSEWNGWTPTDLFPSFLFIVGVSLTLSFVRACSAAIHGSHYYSTRSVAAYSSF